MRPKSLNEFLGSRPPFLIYYLARAGKGHRSRRIPFAEKVTRSGLPARTFAKMSQRLDWSGFSVAQVDAFARGCGVDLFHFKEHRRYVSRTLRTKQGFFRVLNADQKRRLMTLCERWNQLKTI